ncbi:uncharacterized protein isoform X2 [Salmo salar]|uniref:Uncharacterized protein isoform X2 n=1 Tax=Salmo salar TaxID=8030 RepID=A0ABM3DYW5_SALSA|nr:uncharacterized protein LOC106587079 isoform X2 [Salmo salar]
MLGMKTERLPSASVATNFVLEADQVTSDTGAAEFVHEHENAEVCMMDGYCCHLEIREQSAGVEVDQFNIVRKMVQDIVAAAVNVKDTGGHQRGIFAKITSLFDDCVVLETGFKQLISEYKSDILPKMVKRYDFYTHSEKAKLSCVNEVFCGLHLIDSLAHQAKATLLLWEKMIVEDEEVGANRLSDSSKNALESGTVRLVRTVTDTIQAKDGKSEKFKAFLTRKGEFDDVPLAPFRGNRIDTLFHNAAGAYSVHEELVEFTTREYLDDNSFLARFAADFEVQQFKAGCRALGLISKIIIDPLFKSMGDTLKMETRYQTLITKLKEWKEDGRQVVEGTACLFDDRDAHGPCVGKTYYVDRFRVF